MSSVTIIVDQWMCLTEPERQLARAMADNFPLALAGYVGKSTADSLFAAYRGPTWEIYRDFWLANWNIEETTITIMGVEIAAYVTAASWVIPITTCTDDCPDYVPCRCLAVTGFPPCT